MKDLMKPTLEQFDKMLNITNYTDDEIDFLNSYNWSNEVFEVNGKFGVVNCVKEQMVAPNFEDFMLLSGKPLKLGDRVVAMQNKKWGILRIDGGNGIWELKPEFDFITCPNHFVACRKESKWGVLNTTTNEWLLPIELDEITLNDGFLFSNGVAFYGKDGKEGVILSTGEFTTAIFDEIEYDIDQFIKVRIGEVWGYIDEKGLFTEDEDQAYFMDVDPF